MLNGLLIRTFTCRAASPRIFEAISFSQYGANFSRHLSLFSNRGLMSSSTLPFIASSMNQRQLTVRQCDYTASALPSSLKIEAKHLSDIKISLLQNACKSSTLIHVRCIHDEPSKSPSRRLKASNRDNKQTTDSGDDVAKQYVSSVGSGPSEKLSIVQRFKKTYKEHGKVLIAVHLLTSVVWYGGFYGAARWGVNIVPFLESWNFSESYIKPFRAGGAGDFALAYLFYKLATPARYTVTIVGTNLSIKYLKRGGQMKQVANEDTLTSLYKESKTSIKRRSSLEMKKGVKQMKSNITRVRSKLSKKHRAKPKDKHKS